MKTFEYKACLELALPTCLIIISIEMYANMTSRMKHITLCDNMM